MAASTPNTIVLSDHAFVRRETKATAVAITPGSLVEVTAAGLLQVHSTQAGTARKLFAIENPFAGGTTAAIDTDYAVSNRVYYAELRPGDRVYGWLNPGGSVAARAYLESAGSMGAMQAATSGTALADGRIIAQADEAKDNSAGTVAVRLKMTII